MDRPLKLRGGFLLAEMCIAMLIFAIALMLLLQFTLNAQLGSRDARSRQVAALSAEKKMRELRISPYLPDSSDVDTVDHIICNRSWSSKDTSFVRRITVTVVYKSLRGTDRHVTLSGVVK